MKILKLTIILGFLILISTGCNKKEWTEEQKLTLDLQSMAVGSFVSFECFEEYILNNYSGNEYLKNKELIPKKDCSACVTDFTILTTKVLPILI